MTMKNLTEEQESVELLPQKPPVNNLHNKVCQYNLEGLDVRDIQSQQKKKQKDKKKRKEKSWKNKYSNHKLIFDCYYCFKFRICLWKMMSQSFKNQRVDNFDKTRASKKMLFSDSSLLQVIKLTFVVRLDGRSIP